MNIKCPYCGKEIDLKDNFCPNCGHEILEKDKSLSKGQKIKIYVLSVILAPFGLYWFFKFFRDKDLYKRKIAFNVLYISIFMIILLVVLNISLINTLNTYIGSYDMYNLGY